MYRYSFSVFKRLKVIRRSVKFTVPQKRQSCLTCASLCNEKSHVVALRLCMQAAQLSSQQMGSNGTVYTIMPMHFHTFQYNTINNTIKTCFTSDERQTVKYALKFSGNRAAKKLHTLLKSALGCLLYMRGFTVITSRHLPSLTLITPCIFLTSLY